MKTRTRQQGIALVEVLVAVVILAIGLLGTIGLQARAYSALNDASLRGEATIATEKLIGIMSVDQANLAEYAIAAGDDEPSAQLADWYGETKAALPVSTIEVAVNPVSGADRSEVVITIGWQRKATDAANSHRVVTYISQSK
jgi:type IV pilus assembly protein PilV